MASYIERFTRVEKAGEFHNKGLKFTEIARELAISPASAAQLVSEYKELLRMRAEGDPDFLERITENTLEMIDSIDMIIKETWESYEEAKEFNALNMKQQFLKLAMDLIERKAKLLQLMGGRTDGNSVARMNKAERVNEIISGVIKDIISDCDRCKQLAGIKLAEAFSLMNREDQASDIQPVEDEVAVLELEGYEETDEDHSHILGDVLADD